MKNYLVSLLLLVVFNSITAQEKVKGNRNVTTEIADISTFHTIALDEDFEIEIIFNHNPTVEIETDENLHEFIEFQVIDNVLTFNNKARITSKKALNIKVAYNNTLKYIKTADDAEILALATMDLPSLKVNAIGSSKIGLTVQTPHFDFEADDKARCKLNVTSENCSIHLSGTSKLEALINTPNFLATFYQRGNAIIEGSCNLAKIDLDNSSQFNGKNFTINSCDVTCNIGSDAYLEVMENITIEASGTSSIYLYENPKIVINKMTDTSKLQKKVK
ncbi:GIN domain-containing protein [Tamlana flava]|uniref:GIN domain-containing protein n=1 Tax=Tamlana flava TaxID=3158572 RepID=UPI00351B3F80